MLQYCTTLYGDFASLLGDFSAVFISQCCSGNLIVFTKAIYSNTTFILKNRSDLHSENYLCFTYFLGFVYNILLFQNQTKPNQTVGGLFIKVLRLNLHNDIVICFEGK